MDKRGEFNTALKSAMKNKDLIAISTIRLILAALKDKDIVARMEGNGDGITESEVLSMLQSMIKQRRESARTYAEAERFDLAEREEKEIKVIESFLPHQLDDHEVSTVIEQLIKELGAGDIKDMGRIMAELKTRYAGQMDMGRVSGLVKQKLAA
ncbi:MAG: GatB/YqeY domain-containing protein [Rhodospirillales bacterium]|nr:GatB/YqeY domain-containing protein [Rhodospirillales bacterium]